MNKCTWVNCENQQKYALESEDGEIWANLCEEHHQKYQKDIENLNPKNMLSNWVKASGGADKMTKRLLK